MIRNHLEVWWRACIHDYGLGIANLNVDALNCNQDQEDVPHLTESGTGHWSHDYSKCDLSIESPINIDTDSVINDEYFSAFDWNVDLRHSVFSIENDGHSVHLEPREHSGPIATLPDYFDEGLFCLDSLHFHWGSFNKYGSEHSIDGHSFPLEVHFEHRRCDGISGERAVVAIFFDVVDAVQNPAFESIFGDDRVKRIQYPGTVEMIGDLDLRGLIPADVATAGHYAYEGSINTKPCTKDGVCSLLLLHCVSMHFTF